MKLSVVSSILGGVSLDESLAYLSGLGVDEFELGVGGYPGKAHADAIALSKDKDARKKLLDTFAKHNMGISALSVHGNCVHPDKATAERFQADFEAACVLAGQLGIDRLVTFSGCPGDSENSKYPNWVTCPWPDDYLKILDWQWNEKLIPYWKETGKFALDHNVTHIAFEMHPGFCVYNPETMLKLRDAVGEVLGANFDPSHLVWQGIDPVAAIRKLAGAIYHVHAKDTKVDTYNTATNGVLDTKHYSDELHRSWIFRTVGYGNNETYWNDLVSNLRLCGYDKVLSIEHEDSVMTIDEGLKKAIAFLNRVCIFEEKPTTMSWA